MRVTTHTLGAVTAPLCDDRLIWRTSSLTFAFASKIEADAHVDLLRALTLVVGAVVARRRTENDIVPFFFEKLRRLQRELFVKDSSDGSRKSKEGEREDEGERGRRKE